jgi:hypothetical protein
MATRQEGNRVCCRVPGANGGVGGGYGRGGVGGGGVRVVGCVCPCGGVGGDGVRVIACVCPRGGVGGGGVRVVACASLRGGVWGGTPQRVDGRFGKFFRFAC